MTEPPPGAGSDPSALRTRATRVDGGWSITGEKRYISGADGAAFAICMARSDDDGGTTMFLVDADNPGYRVKRVRGSDELKAQPDLFEAIYLGHARE